MNLDDLPNKNILFKPTPVEIEEEIETNQMHNNTHSILNRSSMMTYSKM